MSSQLKEEPVTPKTQVLSPAPTFSEVAAGKRAKPKPTTKSRKSRVPPKANKPSRKAEGRVKMQSLTPKGHLLGNARKNLPADWATRSSKARSNWLRRERRRLAKDPAKAEAARIAYKRRRGKLKQKRKGTPAPSAKLPPPKKEPEPKIRLKHTGGSEGPGVSIHRDLVDRAKAKKQQVRDERDLLDDEVSRGQEEGYVVIPAIPSNLAIYRQHAPDGAQVAKHASLPCSVEAALMYLACQTIRMGCPAGTTFVCYGCHPSWLAEARHKFSLDEINWSIPGAPCGETCPCANEVCNHMLPYSNVIVGPGYAGKWKTLNKAVGGKTFLIYLDGKGIRKVHDGSRLNVSISNLEAFTVVQRGWVKRPGLGNSTQQLGSVRIRERGKFAAVATAMPGSIVRYAGDSVDVAYNATERVLAACKLGPRTIIHAGEWVLGEKQPVVKNLVDIVELAGYGRPSDELTKRLQQRTAVREVLSGEHTLFMGAAATAIASWHYAMRRSLLRSYQWYTYGSVTEALPYLKFLAGGVGLWYLLRPRKQVQEVSYETPSLVQALLFKSICFGFIRSSGIGKGVLSPIVAGLVAAPSGWSTVPSAMICEAGLSVLPLPVSVLADFVVTTSALVSSGHIQVGSLAGYVPLWVIDALASITKSHIVNLFPNWAVERWIEWLRWLAAEKRATVGVTDM